VVGSGLYDIKVERVFVEERVNRAAGILKAEGKAAAFKQFQDPASPFFFLNSYIFVLNGQGETMVDPAFPTLAGRNMSDFRDAVGFRPIKEVCASSKAQTKPGCNISGLSSAARCRRASFCTPAS
jgi:Single Cache domain 2